MTADIENILTASPVINPDALVGQQVSVQVTEPEPPKPELVSDLALEFLLGDIAPIAESSKFKNCCFYGPGGAGKTVLGATTPPPYLFVKAEDGVSSIKNHPELEKNGMAMTFKNFKQLEVLAEKLEEGKLILPGFDEPPATVIFDSLDALQGIDIFQITEQAWMRSPDRLRYKATWPEYESSTKHLMSICSTYCRLPLHFVILAHDKTVKDGSTGALFKTIDITEVFSNDLPRLLDVVGYLTANGEGNQFRNYLQVHPTPQAYAKTRLGGLPGIIENPTFDKLLNPTKYFNKTGE